MKKLLLAVVTVVLAFSSTNLFAQGKYGADSAECIKYLSYYQEYFKQRNYDDALPNWRQAFSICPPTASQNMLLHGTTLVRRLITQNAKNEIYKDALVDTLLTIHDLRAQYYPRYAVTALNNKGLDMANYIKDDPQALYDGYGEIIAANKEQVRAQLVLFHFNAALELYQKGVLGTEDIIKVYQDNLALANSITADSESEKEQNEKIITDIESLFIESKVASCENLIELFTPRYEANPKDLDLASNIVRMMSTTDDCIDNDLYLAAVTTMYELDPSYNSAYFLYRLNSTRGNVEEAIKYMEEAIAYTESDNTIDGEYSYELAAFCYKNGDPLKAMELAKKSIELNEAMTGKANFLMGTIWGSTSCGGDEIAKRAPYWVAVDYLQKAKAADETLAEEANRLISQYARYYPQTAEAFMYDLTDGQSYTVSCNGMRAVTTVRTQN